MSIVSVDISRYVQNKVDFGPAMPPLGHPHPHPSPFTGYPRNAIIDRLHNRTVHAPGRPSLHSVPLQMPSSTDSQPHNPRTVSPWERAISCNQ